MCSRGVDDDDVIVVDNDNSFLDDEGVAFNLLEREFLSLQRTSRMSQEWSSDKIS